MTTPKTPTDRSQSTGVPIDQTINQSIDQLINRCCHQLDGWKDVLHDKQHCIVNGFTTTTTERIRIKITMTITMASIDWILDNTGRFNNDDKNWTSISAVLHQ